MAPQAPTAPAPMPTPPPPDADTIRVSQSPTWDDVLAVLRSDQMRGYRIDIETDATVMQDAEADKQSRIEFVKAAGEMLQQAYQAMTVAPQMLPVIKELFMFSIRGFHAGRSMEETFEDAFDEMAKNLPPPQSKTPAPTGPDPAVAMAEIQRKAQADQMDNRVRQLELQIQAMTSQNKHAAAMGELQRKTVKDQTEAALTSADLQQRGAVASADLHQRGQAAAHDATMAEMVQKDERAMFAAKIASDIMKPHLAPPPANNGP